MNKTNELHMICMKTKPKKNVEGEKKPLTIWTSNKNTWFWCFSSLRHELFMSSYKKLFNCKASFFSLNKNECFFCSLRKLKYTQRKIATSSLNNVLTKKKNETLQRVQNWKLKFYQMFKSIQKNNKTSQNSFFSIKTKKLNILLIN